MDNLQIRSTTGLTLIEILISVGIVVILATLSIFILNPTRQLATGRNAQRRANVEIILNSVGQNSFDNRGSFLCSSGSIPTTTARMAVGTSTYDIAPCLVPIYLQALPFDPSMSGVHYTSVTDYDTGYTIIQNATTGRTTITAPAAELGKDISITR